MPLLLLAVACSSSTPSVTDGGMDSVADVGPTSCADSADCPARHFCGLASRTCVSAVVEVVGGLHHSCARHASGAVSCWGQAESIRGGGAALLAPVDVAEARGARALSAGVHLTCALTDGRRVRCWGNQTLAVARDDGQPLEQVAALAVGNGFGCAASAAGVWCWGRNDFGQLARPLTVTDSAAAVLAHPGAQRFLAAGIAVLAHDGQGRLCAWGRNATKMISAADGVDVFTRPECRDAPDVNALIAGDTHACLRHGDGRFTCWGERYYGQLGIGGSDTADVPPPGLPSSLPPVTALAAGATHTCALFADGTVSCFGRNDRGQIGPGATGVEEEIRTPTAIEGLGPVVGLGAGSSAQHTCAIRADGSVACWGANHAGQLGNRPGGLDPARFSRPPVAVAF